MIHLTQGAKDEKLFYKVCLASGLVALTLERFEWADIWFESVKDFQRNQSKLRISFYSSKV